MTLNNLGHVAFAEEDSGAALALHRQALVLTRELGDKLGMAISLAVLAGVLAVLAGLGDEAGLEQAARILGAVAALLVSIGAVLEPDDRRPYERAVAAMRAALDTEAFAHAWSAGQALSWKGAIAAALAEASDA